MYALPVVTTSFNPSLAPIPRNAELSSPPTTAPPIQEAPPLPAATQPGRPPPSPPFYPSDFAVVITVLEPARNANGLLTIATTVGPPPPAPTRHRRHTGSPLRSVEVSAAALPIRPGTPSSTGSSRASGASLRGSSPAERLLATTERWRREDEERRAGEGRKGWGVRKWERVVGRARERRRRWVEAAREARKRLWWGWQVRLSE